MNGFWWSLIWISVFIFGAANLAKIITIPVTVWYLLGAVLGAVLIIGFVVIDIRREQ